MGWAGHLPDHLADLAARSPKLKNVTVVVPGPLSPLSDKCLALRPEGSPVRALSRHNPGVSNLRTVVSVEQRSKDPSRNFPRGRRPLEPREVKVADGRFRKPIYGFGPAPALPGGSKLWMVASVNQSMVFSRLRPCQEGETSS